jgi:L-threonylcarbamoyladenylate synthase
VQLLRAGDVVAMPTETVYGLAGDGFNPAALARIFEIKRRPLYDPLILHFAGADAAFAVACEVPEQARKLAARFWPGPLTLVERPAEGRGARAGASGRAGTFACVQGAARGAEREPFRPHQPDRRRGRARGTGRRGAAHSRRRPVRRGARIDRARGGRRNDHAAARGRNFRGGDRTRGRDVARATPVDDAPAAPGQLRHHYAPRKALRLLDSGDAVPHSPGAGLLAFGPITGKGFSAVENLSPTGDLREAAANFFRALRALDDDPRVEAIYAAPVPQHGLGLAINERLERASAR